jgi:hypothetical protein
MDAKRRQLRADKSWVEAPHASGSSGGLNALIRKLGRSQLVRFGLVGASGYVINLAVYTASLTLAGVHYELAAFLAFLAAVGNNAPRDEWHLRLEARVPEFWSTAALSVNGRSRAGS